jgi:hypothetical protein
MKYYGKAEETVNKILDAFETGKIPAALAQRFIHRKDNIPCNAWSGNNQLLCAIHGTGDARGFAQWKQAGRRVMAGQKAFYILMPLIAKKKDTETGEEKKILYGFGTTAVFGIESTEIFDADLWASAGKVDIEAENYLKTLPLAEVAEAWNIKLQSYSGENARALGYYKRTWPGN